jgi:hypothetical protein
VLHRVPHWFEIVGRIELGVVTAPSALLDDAVDRTQLVGGHPNGDDLADAHMTHQDTISTPSGIPLRVAKRAHP